MKPKNDTTEPRFNNPLNNQQKSVISNNRIMKKLKQAKHPIEFISSNRWAEYREKHFFTE